jgi:hypothetical protein
LTVPVFVAPLPSPVTVALICSLLGWRTTATPNTRLGLSALRLLGVLINHGEQSFTAPSRLAPINGATAEDDARGEHCQVHTGQGCRVQQTASTRAAETLALARHVIGYLIAGMPAAVVATLLPADEIPDLLGGAAGPMMFRVPRSAASALGRPG